MKKTKDIEIISLLLGVALLLFVIPSVAKYIIRKERNWISIWRHRCTDLLSALPEVVRRPPLSIR